MFKFSPFTPTFLANLSLLIIKGDEKRRFLTYFLCKIGYSVFRDTFTAPLAPTTLPATPMTSPTQKSGVATPKPSRIDAYDIYIMFVCIEVIYVYMYISLYHINLDAKAICHPL